MKIKTIITGATGMVGEGVLLECLENTDVEQVLIINRKRAGFQHPKLKEIVHADFFDLSAIQDQLVGYDACFFCAGVTSVGKNEEEYTKLTYNLTMHVAKILVPLKPAMTFCYVSGASTDSTEKGSSMWARVKGKTENDLQKLAFKAVYNFRPGIMRATPGQKNVLKLYKYIGWMYTVVKALFPNRACTIREVGLAMINATTSGYNKTILEVPDIIELAKSS